MHADMMDLMLEATEAQAIRGREIGLQFLIEGCKSGLERVVGRDKYLVATSTSFMMQAGYLVNERACFEFSHPTRSLSAGGLHR